MRTLVIVEPSPLPIPPETLVGLLGALRSWRQRWQTKMESFEFFAGRAGGWAVLNTTDEGELSQIMMEFPLGPFTIIHVHPTVNGDEALARLTATVTELVATMGGATP